MRMAFKGLYARLRLIIPDSNAFVVSASNQIWLITAVVVVDAVDALFMPLQGEIGDWGAQVPDLDGVVKGCGRKGVWILGVKLDLHDVMGVPLEQHGAFPALLPIPRLDKHIIGATDEDG